MKREHFPRHRYFLRCLHCKLISPKIKNANAETENFGETYKISVIIHNIIEGEFIPQT